MRLGDHAVHADAADLALLLRLRPGFEQTRDVEPHVEPDDCRAMEEV